VHISGKSRKVAGNIPGTASEHEKCTAPRPPLALTRGRSAPTSRSLSNAGRTSAKGRPYPGKRKSIPAARNCEIVETRPRVSERRMSPPRGEEGQLRGAVIHALSRNCTRSHIFGIDCDRRIRSFCEARASDFLSISSRHDEQRDATFSRVNPFIKVTTERIPRTYDLSA